MTIKMMETKMKIMIAHLVMVNVEKEHCLFAVAWLLLVVIDVSGCD